ncbi:MAG: hypothetical protein ER33_04020 [Cyanobium sp. CACIAM 14]|nr:MAG: hypothetical protein ER33_04020 [Cyanobium sp. CACIAM 14]
MQFRVRLLHCDGGLRVVLVTAHEGERYLGSALGEAASAEEAEDRARARLMAGLGTLGPPSSSEPVTQTHLPEPVTRARPPAPVAPPPPLAPVPRPAGTAPAARPEPMPEPMPGPKQDPIPEPSNEPMPEPQEDPQDWSTELTRLDLALRRLGWDREREASYLQRCFGHPSRDRITVYADLMGYLRMIESFEPGCDPATAAVPLRRGDLLQQNAVLLQQLGWDSSRGRRFLEQHLGVSSRQQLSDSDLLRFNMLLEEQTLQGDTSMLDFKQQVG